MDKNIRFVTDLYDVKDKRIGILSLQNYTEPIEFKYEDFQFFHYGKVHILLDELVQHKIDAAILPLPDAILALVNKEYQNIDIVGKMDEKAYVNIGVIDTKPMLTNIVKKALQATAVHYKQDILAKWTQKLNYVEKVDYDLAYKVGALFSIMVFMLGYYTYLLKRRHRYEQKINAKIQEVARTDDLTGLHNKRAFNQNFENGHDDKNTLGLLFIDVDHFKSYNDHYGHMEGDRALKTIAETISSFISASRYPYRIGGEEFGMILYNHTKGEAALLAQKLCKAVESLNILHEKSPYRHITVSIGIAVSDPSLDRHALYLKADKALYRAKTLGRNTTFVYLDKDETLKEYYSDVPS
jgi:diguanylate cyclase (GGDEF)-like protein